LIICSTDWLTLSANDSRSCVVERDDDVVTGAKAVTADNDKRRTATDFMVGTAVVFVLEHGKTPHLSG
jgi:hypothetical protein